MAKMPIPSVPQLQLVEVEEAPEGDAEVEVVEVLLMLAPPKLVVHLELDVEEVLHLQRLQRRRHRRRVAGGLRWLKIWLMT
jgi:hypothetical protein